MSKYVLLGYKPFLFAVLILSFLFNLSGCSCFRSGNQNISVMTTPADARIYVNGNLRGTGMVTARVPRNRTLMVRVEKDGYKPLSRIIEKKLSTTGVLDTIGGWLILVPFIGLAFPGAYELENANLSFQFSELDKI